MFENLSKTILNLANKFKFSKPIEVILGYYPVWILEIDIMF